MTFGGIEMETRFPTTCGFEWGLLWDKQWMRCRRYFPLNIGRDTVADFLEVSGLISVCVFVHWLSNWDDIFHYVCGYYLLSLYDRQFNQALSFSPYIHFCVKISARRFQALWYHNHTDTNDSNVLFIVVCPLDNCNLRCLVDRHQLLALTSFLLLPIVSGTNIYK